MGGITLSEKVELPSGKMAIAMMTDVVPERIITIPESVEYPDIRKPFNSGTFKLGDTIVVSITVIDSEGKDKTPPDSDFKLTLDNYPKDKSKEVLGILYMNFVESNAAQTQTEATEPIKG